LTETVEVVTEVVEELTGNEISLTGDILPECILAPLQDVEIIKIDDVVKNCTYKDKQ
jgi:hypothetical protein